MGKFYQSMSYGPSFMTKFCSALYLENLLTNIFAKLNLRGGVSCMPAALLLKENVHVNGSWLIYRNTMEKAFFYTRRFAEFPENERYHVSYLLILVAISFSNHFLSFGRSFHPKIEYYDIFN